MPVLVLRDLQRAGAAELTILRRIFYVMDFWRWDLFAVEFLREMFSSTDAEIRGTGWVSESWKTISTATYPSDSDHPLYASFGCVVCFSAAAIAVVVVVVFSRRYVAHLPL